MASAHGTICGDEATRARRSRIPVPGSDIGVGPDLDIWYPARDMKKRTARSPALRTRVLRALGTNREANLNFPGIFMGLAARRTRRGDVRFEFDDGRWCRDRLGGMSLPALGVLVDTALGAVARLKAGPRRRSATVHLEMQFTGAPIGGHVATEASFAGYADRTPIVHASSRAKIISGGMIVAHASGSFVMLELPEGRTQEPVPWPPQGLRKAKAPNAASLEDHERRVLERFERAHAAASRDVPFIEHFWCGVPEAAENGASLSVTVTPHLGNRFGHVHGGILFGLAARVAGAAAPAAMRLSNISTWFVSPGEEPLLQAQASVIHRGRAVAVVRTEIRNAAGGLVLEAMSQHIRAADGR